MFVRLKEGILINVTQITRVNPRSVYINLKDYNRVWFNGAVGCRCHLSHFEGECEGRHESRHWLAVTDEELEQIVQVIERVGGIL